MELRVLRYFLAVAEEESITRAAEALHVSQPTLSKQLKDMEEDLGKTLFLRGKRKITLTSEGQFLRERAREILALADKTEAVFHAEDPLIGGSVYIGGGETRGMSFLAKTAVDFHCAYPDVCFHFFSGNGEAVAEQLDKGLLDFGVFVGAADLTKYESIKLPAVDIWGLLLTKGDPLASLPSISPSDLRKTPLLCSTQALKQNEFSAWLGYDFRQLKLVATYNLLFNASLMVEAGLGAAVCIDGLIDTSKSENLCFRPFAPKLTAELAVAWKKHQVFSAAAAKFLALLREKRF